MQFTGKQIAKNGIVTNFAEGAIQQQGVDVRVDKVFEVYGSGLIPVEGSTTKCYTNPCTPVKVGNIETFALSPGYYEVTLMEGCNVVENTSLHFKTRSSLVRCGATVHSGQFDAGFNTKQMGCFLDVRRPIRIERGAAIAQAIVFESYPVDEENLYNGQWQNDKQREEQPAEESTATKTAKKKSTRKKKTEEAAA